MKLRIEHLFLAVLALLWLVVAPLACDSLRKPATLTPAPEATIDKELAAVPEGVQIATYCSQGFTCSPPRISWGCVGALSCYQIDPPDLEVCCSNCKCIGSNTKFCLQVPCS